LKRALEEKTLSGKDVKTAEKIISAQHRPKPRYPKKTIKPVFNNHPWDPPKVVAVYSLAAVQRVR
jgi:hypothetical protein